MIELLKNIGNTIKTHTRGRKTAADKSFAISDPFRITHNTIYSSVNKIGHLSYSLPQPSLSIQIGQMSFDKKFSLDK